MHCRLHTDGQTDGQTNSWNACSEDAEEISLSKTFRRGTGSQTVRQTDKVAATAAAAAETPFSSHTSAEELFFSSHRPNRPIHNFRASRLRDQRLLLS